MRLFTTYSDDTEHLLREFYLPSVPSSWNVTTWPLPKDVLEAPDFEHALAVWSYQQIADELERHPGECILVTGCDQFYTGDCEADLQARMGAHDLLCPRDGEFPCGDFRYIRSTPKTIRAFRNWKRSERKLECGAYWWTFNPAFDMELLPIELYWSAWSGARGYWEPGFMNQVPPATALWVHGNGTQIKHKAELLSLYQGSLREVAYA